MTRGTQHLASPDPDVIVESRSTTTTLAARLPSVERIYAADYEPFSWHTRAALARATWERSCPQSVAKEVRYLCTG